MLVRMFNLLQESPLFYFNRMIPYYCVNFFCSYNFLPDIDVSLNAIVFLFL